MTLPNRKILISTGLVPAAALVFLFLRADAVAVDIELVTKGPLEEVVSSDGKTRVHDRFTIASPVSGHLARIALREGDSVDKGQVVANLDPTPLDPRQKDQAASRLDSAIALEREANAVVHRVRTDCAQAKRDQERAERLAAAGEISTQALEQARNDETTCTDQLNAAGFRARAAAGDVQTARAALLDAERGPGQEALAVTSPVAGTVLRIFETSERIVPAGTPLLELSDPGRLEVVVDVLSFDAVKIKPGARVTIDGWGGETPLQGIVRLVEPAAFTKISALGVEEQRVNVIIDLTATPAGLGDGYRVDAHIVIWESSKAIKVPTNAIFRSGTSWSVFVVESGHARLRSIETAHRNSTETEVTSGLTEGQKVIAHPPALISDGVRVTPR